MTALNKKTIFCFHCKKQHLDKHEWLGINHTRHLCEFCHRFFYEKEAGIGI